MAPLSRIRRRSRFTSGVICCAGRSNHALLNAAPHRQVSKQSPAFRATPVNKSADMFPHTKRELKPDVVHQSLASLHGDAPFNCPKTHFNGVILCSILDRRGTHFPAVSGAVFFASRACRRRSAGGAISCKYQWHTVNPKKMSREAEQ